LFYGTTAVTQNPRVRIRFAKTGRLRFISHLDVMRLFERALRRAGLPLAMTQGFNPRPRLSFPLALPVGVESKEEVFEVALRHYVNPEQVGDLLGRRMPPGVHIVRTDPVAAGARKPVVEYVSYELTLCEEDPESTKIAEDILTRSEIRVTRDRKGRLRSVDLRPFIRSVRATEAGLRFDLSVSPDGMTEPYEVLEAIGAGLDRRRRRLVRTRVALATREQRED